jgi:hypothetical protein
MNYREFRDYLTFDTTNALDEVKEEHLREFVEVVLERRSIDHTWKQITAEFRGIEESFCQIMEDLSEDAKATRRAESLLNRLEKFMDSVELALEQIDQIAKY